jgi:CRISPR-associated protein Cas5d
MHDAQEVVSIEIWGEFACFTRPEMKIERMSYPAPTPSAMRGVLDAIYWKPTFRWQVRRIEILRPVRFITLRRNEVKQRAPSHRTIQQWMTGRKTPEPLWADVSTDWTGTDKAGRTQRQTVALKDVRYRVHAEPVLWQESWGEHKKILEQFTRRVAHGQCHHQPSLGVREFPAYFAPVIQSDAPISDDIDIGWMVYDVFDLGRPGHDMSSPHVSVFRARVVSGVLEVPSWNDPAVVHVRGAEGMSNA